MQSFDVYYETKDERTERARLVCPKTLNPRQKKSAKKKSEFFSSPSHITNPHRLLYALFERERHIFVLSLVLSLSLSLCTYIVRFETLSVYIFVFRSRECALISGAEEERLTHHTYIIYIRVGGEIWIGSTGKKRVSECLEGRKLKREEV